MFQNSVTEYKIRGSYGDASYRGNTSGYIVRDFLQLAHRDLNGLFCDPMEGGKTSRDVAKEMNIRYQGFDLKTGFNILKDDLGTALGEYAESIFSHPAYFNMITYSSNPDDLSQNATLNEFLKKLQLAAMNIYDALRPGGMYGLLMGNWRKNGVYYPLCSLMLSICPGALKEEIVKVQNNVSSDRRIYSGAGSKFVPIKHEILYIWEKTSGPLLSFAIDFSDRLLKLHTMTWKNLIRRIFMRYNKTLSVQEVYLAVMRQAPTEKLKNSPNWKAKVRQVLQDDRIFTRRERGYYSLKVA